MVSINSVTDGRQNDRTSDFKIVPVGASGNTFKIQTNDFFTFTEDSNVNESYTFNLLASDNSGSSYFTDVPLVIKNCTLQNSAPNWLITLPASTSITLPIIPSPFNQNDIKVFEFNVSSLTNGSAGGGSEGLRLSLLDAGPPNPPPGAAQFYINKISAIKWALYMTSRDGLNGTYGLKIKATDANGTGLSTESNSFQVVVS